MTPRQKKRILDILQQQKGDDLYRAQMSFRGLNLDEQHGSSGLTRRQILEGYTAHENQIDDLITAFEADVKAAASVPDLIHACQECLNEIRAYNGESEFEEGSPVKDWCDMLKATLSKAGVL